MDFVSARHEQGGCVVCDTGKRNACELDHISRSVCNSTENSVSRNVTCLSWPICHTHTHTPHELSRTFCSHICALCCVWVPDVDNDCTGVSFQNLLQTQDCISSLWTRCAVDTLRQYEISSLNDTTKGHVSGYIIEWNYPTHRWAWMWSVLLVRAFRYTGNKNEWIVWWCGWTWSTRITLPKGFLDSLAYTDDTYGFTLFCVIEWFTFVYISVSPQRGRRDISVGVVIRIWAGRPRNRS